MHTLHIANFTNILNFKNVYTMYIFLGNFIYFRQIPDYDEDDVSMGLSVSDVAYLESQQGDTSNILGSTSNVDDALKLVTGTCEIDKGIWQGINLCSCNPKMVRCTLQMVQIMSFVLLLLLTVFPQLLTQQALLLF